MSHTHLVSKRTVIQSETGAEPRFEQTKTVPSDHHSGEVESSRLTPPTMVLLVSLLLSDMTHEHERTMSTEQRHQPTAAHPSQMRGGQSFERRIAGT